MVVLCCNGCYRIVKEKLSDSAVSSYVKFPVSFQVICIEKFHRTFSAYFTVGYHEHINEIEEIIYGATEVYVMFARHYGDLHSYVRRRRRLREGEAWELFRQIMLAVQHCHSEGLVLRDLKLRKFVFKNPQK